MKIVIAADSFKESMSAVEVCQGIEDGFRRILSSATFIKIPIGDGGEGTALSLTNATGGKVIRLPVTGPLGDTVDGFYGISGDGKTAFIEMAAASGIHLVPSERRNPLIATTKGTGELIMDALNRGVSHIILGLGGSATNDGGTGMAASLGVRFLDETGHELPPRPDMLGKLASIDITSLDPRLKNVRIEAACDVDNPLTGERGASFVFGPQKGATEEIVTILDRNLANYAKVLEKCLGKPVKDIPGTGAAGGMGAAVIAFLDGKLKKGIDIVLDFANFDHHLHDASLVITGEGKIDSQTVYGKAPAGVAKRAKKYGLPVIAVAGSLGTDYEVVFDHGIDAVFSIVQGVTTLQNALEQGRENLVKTCENIARLLQIKTVVSQRPDKP
ncbi:glycerate kinase [Thermoactinomyces mirandus]|uniref:Glycerate kinase n=1 Tax=Thermoactinomyces mirandus TaxID=2756294 RepID=A0A7W1XQI5_9BACL|nr:glycerate kinase [Thermoactinomyces mirandus]MBA4601305.1 glycerate kinase [Thermoactinomyces mirandus]